MAYSTGSAASITALVDAIRVFAVANGWTQTDDGTYSLAFSVGAATQTNQYAMASNLPNNTISSPTSPVTAKRTVLSKGGVYFQIFGYLQQGYKNKSLSTNAFIECWVSDAYTTGTTNAHTQTNLRKTAICGSMTQSFINYHLFTNATGDYIHCVIEETAGYFRHFAFGQLTKYCTFTGGQYVQGTFWPEASAGGLDFGTTEALIPFGANGMDATSSYYNVRGFNSFRADLDSVTNKWILQTKSQSVSQPAGYFGMTSYCNDQTNNSRASNQSAGSANAQTLFGDIFYDGAPMAWNGVAPLCPLMVTATRSTINLWSLLGEFPDVRYINIKNLSPGDEITLGADTWKVFPIFCKSNTWVSGQATPLSYEHGLAYKKIS